MTPDQFRAALAAEIRSIPGVVQDELASAMTRAWADVVQHAPVETGDYADSIQMILDSDRDVHLVTDHPAANALEFGDAGADSLGRVVDKPPQPHFGPGVRSQRRPLERRIGERLTGGS